MVIFSLQYWIELKVGNAFSENILLRFLVLVLFFLCGWLSSLTTSLFAFMLAHFAFDSVDASLVQTHVIDHVLDYAVDVLVTIGEGYLERSASAT